MTAQNKLKTLLDEEERLLRARDFGALPEIQERKEEVMLALVEAGDRDSLEKVREQAERNEKLLGSLLNAARGLNARFGEMASAAAAVGYGPDGTRMSMEREKLQRRV